MRENNQHKQICFWNKTCLIDWIWNCCPFFKIKFNPHYFWWQKTIRTNISAFEELNLIQWLNLKLLSFFSKENLTHIIVTVEKSKQICFWTKLVWLIESEIAVIFSKENLTHITVTVEKSKQTNLLLKLNLFDWLNLKLLSFFSNKI